jgi:hypothetical protein
MTKSLAAEKGALSTPALNLPSVFQEPAAPLEGRKLAPYIVFAHPKRADEWAKITAKYQGVEEGDMFLVTSDGPRKLDSVRLSVLTYKQFWAQANPKGELIATSFKELPNFKENIELVALAYIDDRIVPVNVSPKSTKCAGMKALSDALVECQTPAWAEKGQAYKDSLVCQQPFARFYGEMKLSAQRTSKSTGLPYRTTQIDIKPTSTPEWRALKEFAEDPAAQELMEAAARRFQFRMDEVKKKLIP